MKMWRVFLYFLAVTLVFFSCSGEEGFYVSQAGVDQNTPDFTLLNLNKEPVTLSSFREKRPALLFFWATWCPFCRQQIPELVRLRDQYSREALEILAIDIQETGEEVAPYAEKMGMNYTVLLDATGAVSGSYGIVGVPTLILVDKEGKRIHTDHALTRELLGAIKKSVS